MDAARLVSDMTRIMPRRSPSWLARICSIDVWLSSIAATSGVSESAGTRGVVAWMTPTVRPSTETGTHTADAT